MAVYYHLFTDDGEYFEQHAHLLHLTLEAHPETTVEICDAETHKVIHKKQLLKNIVKQLKTLSDDLGENIHLAEKYINELNSIYESVKITDKMLAKYNKLLQGLNAYIQKNKHREHAFDSETGTVTSKSLSWTTKFQLLKSRVYEFEAVIKQIDGQPSESRALIDSANAELPRESHLITELPGNYQEQPPAVTPGTIDKLKSIGVIVIIIIIAIFLMTRSNTSDDGYTDEAPDYCDTAICR